MYFYYYYFFTAVRSGRSLADVDEVTRHLALTGGVRLKITKHAVLHPALEGLTQQTCEALQAVGVVGQTKLTAKDRNVFSESEGMSQFQQ